MPLLMLMHMMMMTMMTTMTTMTTMTMMGATHDGLGSYLGSYLADWTR